MASTSRFPSRISCWSWRRSTSTRGSTSSVPRPAALKPHLRERFFDATATPAERVNAALVLARYADAALFTELLLEGGRPAILDAVLGRARGTARPIVEAARKASSPGRTTGRLTTAPPQASGAEMPPSRCCVSVVRRTSEPYLSISDDPTVRTMVILEMRDFGIPPEQVLDVLNGWNDPTARQALLLALEPYRGQGTLAGHVAVPVATCWRN